MSADDESALDPTDVAQRRALLQVLMLNAALAVALFAGGLIADSSALLANALDNASDAMTYVVSYLAVTRSQRWKSSAAAFTGVMLLVLALGVSIDAIRRFITGSDPVGFMMLALAFVAIVINTLSIKLLRKHRREDVNLRAVWTMSINDFVSNFGIIIAGGLVWLLGNNWPDLAVALAIAAVATYGGIMTLRDALGNRGNNAYQGSGDHSRD
jgi:cobalt-zinc-cadmium efflux system protein